MSLLNEFKGKKIFQISHNDLDGVVSTLVSIYYLHNISQLDTWIIANREHDLTDIKIDDLKSYDFVLFTDVAPTKEFYNQLLALNKPKIYIFDHHVTTYNDLGNLENYYYTLDKCGSRIFYDALVEGIELNPVLDKIIQLTDTYDLFKTNDDLFHEAKGLHNCLYGSVNWKKIFSGFPVMENEKYKRFVSDQLYKIYYNKSFGFNFQEKATIQTSLDKEEKEYRECKRKGNVRQDSNGDNYFYMEAGSKVSFVANRIMNEMKEKIKYVLSFNIFEKERMKFSVRSLPDYFNTTDISKKYGGGGHEAASGFELTDKELCDKIRSGNYLI